MIALLNKMTLREKVGQLLCLDIKGIHYTEDDPKLIELEKAIQEDHIGGIILFWGNAKAGATLLNRLQKLSKTPLLVGSDVERGVGQILTGGTEFTSNMAVGATFNPDFAYQQGAITAQEARAVGIHVIYAPVADVNNNPNNPIINTRSYGEDATWVGQFVASYIRGVQKNGAIATAKHFPGHGDVIDDSHAKLPILNITKERFNQIEKIPFQNAIEANVKQIMSAHIALPKLTHDNKTPATLSKPILTHLLREEMAFNGLIVSDALNMGGVREGHAEEELAILALEAGVDILLYPTSVKKSIDSIIRGVETGQISEERINESVLKILQAKSDLGLFKEKLVSEAQIPTLLKTSHYHSQALTIARKSITLIDDNRYQPITYNSTIQLVIFDEDESSNIGHHFITALNQRSSNLCMLPIISPANIHQINNLLNNIKGEAICLIALFSKIKAWKEKSGINQQFIKAIQSLLDKQLQSIVISFGSPYMYNELDHLKSFICTYSQTELSQLVCAEALFGEIPFEGMLPVSLKNHPLRMIEKGK